MNEIVIWHVFQVIGFSMYFFVYSWEGKAAHMEDLFVTEAYRGTGIGTKVT